jgi:hypothetical protein
MTELGLDAEGLNETVLHLNLGFFCFVLFFSPLMRQQQNYFADTNTRTGGKRTNTKIIKTETFLHLGIFFFIILALSL